MGGKAFLAKIPGAVFPRMKPDLYYRLKAHHLAQLQNLFVFVGVPREAPGKLSHGDIDFLVFGPRNGQVSPDTLKTLFGAEESIANNNAVNLAVRLADDGTFYQVDINRCQNEDEWKRMMFFQSYGDLGMILGMVARNNDLSLGLHGLKLPGTGGIDTPFLLSVDFERILQFFGLSYATWDAGFESEVAVFEWVASSPLFDERTFREEPGRERRREGRKMYQAFLEWVRERKKTKGGERVDGAKNVIEEAMEFFGVKEAYYEELERTRKRRRTKEALSGKLVMEWTGMDAGPQVGKLIATVKERLGEDTIAHLTPEELRVKVLEISSR